MSKISVKICGLTRTEDARAVVKSGARYAGFVYFDKSPRAVKIDQAVQISNALPIGLMKVALVVDAQDDLLDAICARGATDMLQLHGHETPQRVAQIKARYGLPVMKAIGIAGAEDLPLITQYSTIADQLLIDAKPPKDATIPGGNGLAFDWRLLAKRKYWTRPWMLAGGLTPENVAQAVQMTGARQVDVSSGVESAPGVKDPELISAFVDAATGVRAKSAPILR